MSLRWIQFASVLRCARSSSAWEKLTSDTVILNMVTGFKIPFTEIPQQQALPKRPSFTEQETLHIEAEITKLLKCRVLVKCEKEKGDYFSNIFLRPKRNVDYCMILILKGLNKYIPYHHFKMENLKSAIRMMSKNCYFSSVDLSDAYYSCPVHVSFKSSI